MILEDTQSRPAEREIPIDQVGISELRLPLTVLDRAHQKQQVTATVSASVSLPRHFKGTHMSRFIEILHETRDNGFNMRTIPEMLRTLKERLEAQSARIEMKFPYFLEKKAPESGIMGLMDYDCTLVGEANGTKEQFSITVDVPVASLCPCSKAISEYGAHNQRGRVTIEVSPEKAGPGKWELIWIEELVEVAEASGSSPVYSVLKRPDERHVTMKMYENPVFVEDIVRNVAAQLMDDTRVARFSVHAVNHESIHNHNAFARIDWTREG